MKRLLAVIALCVAVTACLPPGSKLLNMEVASQTGVLFETNFSVPDTSDLGDVWDAAGRCPFSLLREVDTLPQPEGPEAGQTLAELEGVIAISIMWTGELEARVELDGATVEKCSGCCPGWHLTQETVRRAKGANGL